MFAITKLSKESQDFISTLASNGSRSTEASIAIARVVAYDLSIPTSAVENSQSFYRLNHQIDVEKVVCSINEICIVDVKCILDLIQKFYEFRYQNTYPEQHILAFNTETAICDFFKISKVFDKAILDVIQANPTVLTNYVGKFKQLITELKA